MAARDVVDLQPRLNPGSIPGASIRLIIYPFFSSDLSFPQHLFFFLASEINT